MHMRGGGKDYPIQRYIHIFQSGKTGGVIKRPQPCVRINHRSQDRPRVGQHRSGMARPDQAKARNGDAFHITAPICHGTNS